MSGACGARAGGQRSSVSSVRSVCRKHRIALRQRGGRMLFFVSERHAACRVRAPIFCPKALLSSSRRAGIHCGPVKRLCVLCGWVATCSLRHLKVISDREWSRSALPSWSCCQLQPEHFREQQQQQRFYERHHRSSVRRPLPRANSKAARCLPSPGCCERSLRATATL